MDQAGDHDEHHEHQAYRDQKHGDPEGIDHHRRYALLLIGDEGAGHSFPGDDDQEENSHGQSEGPKNSSNLWSEPVSQEVNLDVATFLKGPGRPPKDDSYQEERGQFINE